MLYIPAFTHCGGFIKIEEGVNWPSSLMLSSIGDGVLYMLLSKAFACQRFHVGLTCCAGLSVCTCTYVYVRVCVFLSVPRGCMCIRSGMCVWLCVRGSICNALHLYMQRGRCVRVRMIMYACGSVGL